MLAMTICRSSAFAAKTVTILGLTEPVGDVTLSLEVGGRIAQIFFKEGEHVPKGSCILELNKKYEELEVKRRKLIWESKAEVHSASERAKTLKALLTRQPPWHYIISP